MVFPPSFTTSPTMKMISINWNLKFHKHMCFFSLMILLLTVFGFPSIVQTETTTFSFNRFTSDMSDIFYEGDALAVDPAIKLTKSFNDLDFDGSSVGRATYFKPIHLWDKASNNVADFNTSFIFSINSHENASRGNGFAFFLTNNGSKLQPSSGNGRLGLSSENNVRSPFVAVEFDTGYSPDWDPEDREDHIGIDINSLSSSNFTDWSYNDIETGGSIQAWIEYNSSSTILSVHVTNGYYKSYIQKYPYDLDYAVDLRNHLSEWITLGFSASTTIDLFEEHEITAWEFSSNLQLDEKISNQTGTEVVKPNPAKRWNKAWLWALLGTSGFLVLASAVVGLVYFGYWRKKKRRQQKEDSKPTSSTKEEFENETGPRSFSFEELVVATNSFADDRILGKGGFGMVYLGFLGNNSSCVAVKRITSDSEQGLKAYVSEVKTISRLRHRNLVQLLGWCRKKQQLLIVYEFMPNKSLDFHLFNQTGLLTWKKRYSIALGLASGLLYLHEECEQCVLHRDIKSSNVLLDSNFNAKVGDFGQARLVEHGQGTDTTRLIGTVGYVSPEYLQSRKATKETDVYGFGIVALEIATGKPAFKETDGNGTDKLKLVEWIWEQHRRGNICGAADPLLNQDYVREEIQRLIVVGLACAHPSPSHRLSIREAIDVLNAKAPMPILPSEIPALPNISSYQAKEHTSSAGSSTLGATVCTQTSTSSTSRSSDV